MKPGLAKVRLHDETGNSKIEEARRNTLGRLDSLDPSPTPGSVGRYQLRSTARDDLPAHLTTRTGLLDMASTR